MHSSFLFQAFVYLAATVLAVTVAKRFGLGSVLGYLLAGAAIGPHALGLVGGNGEDVMHFAEFGVVMMLFLIGLELRPALLWRLRVPVLGMGGAQVFLTALLISGAALILGLPWKPALALGLILAMSSTAIVLQSLQERKWLKTRGGQASFSVLLFQDMAVIPILALMPLLAATSGAEAGHGGPLETFSSWQQALLVLGAVAGVVGGGRFLSRPVFRFIAGAGLREVFTAFALLLVIGISLLMQSVGLSPALGAFLAGVVLADSEYRHELESDIEPFKGLLLGLFFVAVGAGVDFPFILEHGILVAALVLGVMFLKFVALYAVAKVFLRERGESLLFSISLSQVGEFAFVLLALAGSLGVLTGEWTRLGVAVTALSMVASPPQFFLLDKLMAKKPPPVKSDSRDMDAPEPGAAILAGFGRMGSIVGRLLMANGLKTTVLDLNPELVENSRKLGLKAYYGDASRLDLLHAAGAAQAKVLIVAIKNPEKAMEIAQLAHKHFPRLGILIRATERVGAYALINAGFSHVYRETFGTALQMGEDAMRLLGMRAHQAHRATLAFRRHNEGALRELARHWGGKNYWTLLRSKIEEAEGLFKDGALKEQVEAAWNNEALREEAAKGELRR